MHAPASPEPALALTDYSFTARSEFVIDLARRLHAYGTTTPRLEAAVILVARMMGLRCEVWANPTGIIVSFGGNLGPEGGPENTRVLRMEPGEVDLSKLCAVDAIAEDVLADRIDLPTGVAALRALDAPPRWREQMLSASCFGLAAASVAGLLRASWVDLAVAGAIGTVIGTLYVLGASRPRLSESLDALAALVAAVLAMLLATVLPLSLTTVIVASLIVLMPGMMLTNAVAELTSNNLISGTARFAGAMTTLLKLGFGTVAAVQTARLVGWEPVPAPPETVPAWTEWAALGAGAIAFAVLFKAARRDWPLVIFAVALGYGVTRGVGSVLETSLQGFAFGVFLAAIAVTVVSNVYARWFNRPGALIRVPGIILLVPGSTSFRSLAFVLDNDLTLGMDTAVALLNALVALMGGLMLGNLMIPARRNL
ncbi:threonine/serine ThrE exporter family protein [Coralloluteibacterium stylophorae]|uniref:Threonine/serine exporter family protein n=1 Tax=Coralloluteibacterium stylophorae TaxID=1776034 RepID=A0A8J8B0C2_9GAMM|nr:threonine/serine exporter family protein [Coralloluteibacterium stylophorae]MBS7457802.1 threonine/serine exporter family protein [Coralloluteibacterium stylophorae]